MGKTHTHAPQQKSYSPEEVITLLQQATSHKPELEKKLYTVNEVAKILQTSTDYVYKLRDAGLLKFILVGRWKVRVETLNEFLSKYDGYDISDPYNVKALAGASA